MSLKEIEDTIIYNLVWNPDIEVFLELSLTSLYAKRCVSSPFVLESLAEINGLPYSDTLEQLLTYSLLSPGKLLDVAIVNNDRRVIDVIMSRIRH